MEKTPAAKTLFIHGYMPQLDGLRGVAILLVLISHSVFLAALPHGEILKNGRFGVDLFFVLSGFLITGILLDSKGSEHYFRNFYARRALRIWPLYYLLLFLTFLVAPLFAPSLRSTAIRVWPAFVFYVQNIVFMSSPAYPLALGVTWSLAVEEQFYMTWPALVFLFKKRTLAIILVVLAAVSLCLRLAGLLHDAPLGFLHYFTLARLDAIALGSLMAIWLRSPGCTLAAWRARGYQFLILGGLGVALVPIVTHKNGSIVGYTFMAVGLTGVLGLSLASDTKASLLGRALNAKWLRFVGRISYGAYLLHPPVFILWSHFIAVRSSTSSHQIVLNLMAFAGQMLLTTIVAVLSWRFFERPILGLKERFPSGSSMHWPAASEWRHRRSTIILEPGH